MILNESVKQKVSPRHNNDHNIQTSSNIQVRDSNSKVNDNKFVNILNKDGNATFTVSMTMNTHSQINSLNSNAHNVNTETEKEKKFIKEHILEEMDPDKECSPHVVRNGKNLFEFDSDDSRNSYNYIHVANKSFMRNSDVLDTHPLNTNGIVSPQVLGNRFNNVDIGDALDKSDVKFSSLNNVAQLMEDKGKDYNEIEVQPNKIKLDSANVRLSDKDNTHLHISQSQVSN